MATKTPKLFNLHPFAGKKCRNCTQPFPANIDLTVVHNQHGDRITTCPNCQRMNLSPRGTQEVKLVKRKDEADLRLSRTLSVKTAKNTLIGVGSGIVAVALIITGVVIF